MKNRFEGKYVVLRLLVSDSKLNINIKFISYILQNSMSNTNVSEIGQKYPSRSGGMARSYGNSHPTSLRSRLARSCCLYEHKMIFHIN